MSAGLRVGKGTTACANANMAATCARHPAPPPTRTPSATLAPPRRGAGTDADVFIELYGDKGTVGQTRLDTKANNFERNARDEFKVKSASIGDLQKVIIWHNNGGPSPAWHLRQVCVGGWGGGGSPRCTTCMRGCVSGGGWVHVCACACLRVCVYVCVCASICVG